MLYHFPTGLSCSDILLLLVFGVTASHWVLSSCESYLAVSHLREPLLSCRSMGLASWEMSPPGDRSGCSLCLWAPCTALFVSEDGKLPDHVSKLSFLVGNTTVLLCKPRVGLEYCAQFWPSRFQKDIAELEEVLHGWLGEQ